MYISSFLEKSNQVIPIEVTDTELIYIIDLLYKSKRSHSAKIGRSLSKLEHLERRLNHLSGPGLNTDRLQAAIDEQKDEIKFHERTRDKLKSLIADLKLKLKDTMVK